MDDEDATVALLADELRQDTRASVLHHAVADGQLERVTQLAVQADLLAACDGAGRTPLHWAAALGYYEITRVLVRMGAPLGLRDAEGKTPCDAALSNDVQVYLEAASDVHLHSLRIELPRYPELEKHVPAMLTAHEQLESVCQSLELSTPLTAVSKFPGAARAQAQAEKSLCDFLTSTALAQVAYLTEMRLRTGRLDKQRAWHAKTLASIKRIETLADHVRRNDERITDEMLRQYQSTVEILNARLAESEQRASAIDAEFARCQEQMRDMLVEKERLEHMLVLAQRAAASAAASATTALPKALAVTPAAPTLTTTPSADGALALATPQADLAGDLSAAQVAALPPQELVAWLRRRRGFDISVPPHMAGCLTSLRATLTSALHKLASDIYSSASRFVVELIQNADDNAYAPEAQPSFSLEFELLPAGGYVLATNNEVGFQNANVVAVCDIGGSTKSDAEAYIGRKGIGFKSVFKVSDTPHIFSRRFAFRFDARGPLGHILPSWVDADALDERVAALMPAWPVDADEGWRDTRIYLPLRADHHLDKEIMADVGGVDHILLFLRRLQRLAVSLTSRDADGNESSFQKEIELVTPRGSVRTQLAIRNTTTGETSTLTFHVHRKKLLVPSHLLEDDSRAAYAEIALAFPVLPAGAAYPEQFVFCYLPVKQAGLTFIVHADFELVASRQDIHHGKPLNVWLRDQIAPFFVECLHADAHVRALLHVFLPSPNDAADAFWRVHVEQLWNLIATESCILSESGRLRAPTEVHLKVPGFEDLITNDELSAALDREWIAPSFDRALAESKLHVRQLSVGDLIACVGTLPLADKSAAWFEQLYALLQARLDELDEHVGKLAALKVLRLSTGALVSLADVATPLFQSLPADAAHLTEWAREILMDPATVTPRTTTLLTRLGVGVPDERAFAQFIVHDSRFRNRASSRKQFWMALDYVRTHEHFFDEGEHDVVEGEVTPLGALLTLPDHGGQLHRPLELYLPHATDVFAGVCQVRVVDASFMALLPPDGSGLHSWVAFLAKLGVARYPRLLRQPDGSLSMSPELEHFFDAAVSNAEAYGRLVAMLDEWWDVLAEVPAVVDRLRTMEPWSENGTRYARKRVFSRLHFEALCGEYLVYAPPGVTRPSLMDALGICWEQTPPELCECIMQVSEFRSPNASTWKGLYAQLHRALLRGELQGIRVPLPYVWLDAVDEATGEALAPTAAVRWTGDPGAARAAGLVVASAVDRTLEGLFIDVFGVKRALSVSDYATALRRLKATPLLSTARLVELQRRRDEPAAGGSESDERDCDDSALLDDRDPSVAALAMIYTGINDHLENDPTCSVLELEGLPLLLEGAEEGGRVWLPVQTADPNRPVFLDDVVVWRTFEEVFRAQTVFPSGIVDRALAVWCPTLLLALDAVPVSAFISCRLVSRNSPAINHAKSIMYRRAIAVVSGSATGAAEPVTPEAEENIKRLADYLLVYDIKQLTVRRTLRARRQTIAQADTAELFFFQRASEARPPMLFVDVDLNGKLALNFDILHFLTGYSIASLHNALSNPAMLKLIASDLHAERVATQQEREEWERARAEEREKHLAAQRERDARRGDRPRGGPAQPYYNDDDEDAEGRARTGPRERRGQNGDGGERRRDQGGSWVDEDGDDISQRPNRPRHLPDILSIRSMSKQERVARLMADRRSMSTDRGYHSQEEREQGDRKGRKGGAPPTITPFYDPFAVRRKGAHVRGAFGGRGDDVGLPRDVELPPTAFDRPLLPNTFKGTEMYLSGVRTRFLDMALEDVQREFSQHVPKTHPSELVQEAARQKGLRALMGRPEMVKEVSGEEEEDRLLSHLSEHQLGHVAECFFYEYMRRHVPGFSEKNWVSGTRERFFPALGPGDNRLGYDFEYIDEGGVISGARGTRYLFEIKALASPIRRTFYISDNEWQRGLRASRSTNERYVIIIVCLHPEPARVLFWLEDPEQLRQEGVIDLHTDMFAVHLRTRPIFDQHRYAF